MRFHRFGDSNEEHDTLFAIPMPSKLRNNVKTPRCDYAEFRIKFNVIEATLPFLIGLPSLRFMKATLNFNYLCLGLHIGNQYLRVDMKADRNHAYLPFRSNSEQRSHCSVGSTPTFYTPSGRIGRGGNSRGMYYRRVGDFPHSKHTNGRYSAPSQCPQLWNRILMIAVQSSEIVRSVRYHHPKQSFDARHIKKLHLQLRHGTATQMRDWISAAGRWRVELDAEKRTVLLACPCKLAQSPRPHPVVSSTVPARQKMADVAIYIVYINGTPVLHSVGKCTGWSETGVLRRRELSEQIDLFKWMRASVPLWRPGV